MLRFACPKCQAGHTSKTMAEGDEVTCKKCGRNFQIAKTPRFEIVEDDDDRPIRKRGSGATALRGAGWCVTAILAFGLVGVWFLRVSESRLIVDEAAISASSAFMIIALYVIARAVDRAIVLTRRDD